MKQAWRLAMLGIVFRGKTPEQGSGLRSSCKVENVSSVRPVLSSGPDNRCWVYVHCSIFHVKCPPHLLTGEAKSPLMNEQVLWGANHSRGMLHLQHTFPHPIRCTRKTMTYGYAMQSECIYRPITVAVYGSMRPVLGGGLNVAVCELLLCVFIMEML